MVGTSEDKMLEVKLSQLNENTGHWRMSIHSTITKCNISLIETEDGITTYKDCPKKITDSGIIEKLKYIKERHLTPPVSQYGYYSASDAIDDLIEKIQDRPHLNKKEGIGFPVGIPKLVDVE